VTITSLIGDVQRRYIEFFTAVRDRISTSEENVAAEVLIALNNEHIPYPYRYLRVDVLSKNADGAIKPFELTLDPDPNFEATTFKFGGVQVAFFPFSWNRAQIVFEKAIADQQQLERFITRWLDVEETEAHAYDNLSGAAHSFTAVESNGEWWYLTVDFGTAPAEAMIEFIEILASHGVTRITIKAG
jgi:hypothetical protein